MILCAKSLISMWIFVGILIFCVHLIKDIIFRMITFSRISFSYLFPVFVSYSDSIHLVSVKFNDFVSNVSFYSVCKYIRFYLHIIFGAYLLAWSFKIRIPYDILLFSVFAPNLTHETLTCIHVCGFVLPVTQLPGLPKVCTDKLPAFLSGWWAFHVELPLQAVITLSKLTKQYCFSFVKMWVTRDVFSSPDQFQYANPCM